MTNRSSLKLRLVVSSALWIVVALMITGGLIIYLFKGHIEQRFEHQLNDHMEELVAVSEIDDVGKLILTWEPSDPRFNRPHSGWYWQIVQDGEVTRQSRSILSEHIPPLGRNRVEDGVISGMGPDGQPLRILVRTIHLPRAIISHVFIVAGPVSDILDDIYKFATSTAIVLVVLALILIGIMVLQVGYGLGPLRRIQQSLSAIRIGHEKHLPDDFPIEVQPLVSELNSLMDYNTALLQRARTQVGNLAHSLKNPIGIAINTAKELEGEQGESMRRHLRCAADNITRYLRKARIAGTGNVLGACADLEKVGLDIKYSLDILYQEKNLDIRLDGLQGIMVRMDSEDLEEALGNLMDNACKWATHQITVRTLEKSEKITLLVCDDGPGIQPDRLNHVMKRGIRLDENETGDGLGLGIVEEIITLYGGTFVMEEAKGGGLQVKITLPRFIE
ncbi:MAG: HAMP domain-containing histidine kinase [Magnetococcales bacterium]|nr:HAMP domain-containing histidine kinase [Magnetococcales bacterium]